MPRGIGRRQFLGTCLAATGGVVAAGALRATAARANNHPAPRPSSLDRLDRAMYVRHMAVRNILFPGESFAGLGAQIMAVGERRYLLARGGDVIDVSEPLRPQVLARKAFQGTWPNLGYSKALGKWILITSAGVPPTSSTPQAPNGKYDDPSLIDKAKKHAGLRGMRVYDATDPAKPALLAEFSTDGADPKRPLQSGSGCGANYYDGGRYAYLDTAPDDSFIHMESFVRYYTNCLMIVDLADPATPSRVSTWWLPGQRADEQAQYQAWPEYGDRLSFTCKNGPFIVPKKVEDGGKYAYSTWGSFGLMIHDVSDVKHPRLVGRFRPGARGPGIEFFAADVTRLDRGFVITNPEALNPDCNQPYQDSWVVDVVNPGQPRAIGKLPRPVPPPEAPYDDFCNKRGRFGAFSPPQQKAPGRARPGLTFYSYFVAGLQCYDLRDAKNPRILGAFIPPQGGQITRPDSYHRTVEDVLVEWDRNLIWTWTNTGLYLLTTPLLGDPVFNPMAVREWTLPGLNEGHP
jgi:hypothetical protein